MRCSHAIRLHHSLSESHGVEVLPSCCWLYTTEMCHSLVPGHFAFYELAPDNGEMWCDEPSTEQVLAWFWKQGDLFFSLAWKQHYFCIPRLGMPFWPHLGPVSGHLRDTAAWGWPWLHSSVPLLATPMLAVGSGLDMWREGMNRCFPDRYHSQVVEATAKSMH